MQTLIAVGVVLTFLLSLVAVLTIPLKLGRKVQSVDDKLAHIDERGQENKENINRVLQVLEAHAKNQTIHVNAELQALVLSNQQEFNKRIEGKLDELLKGQK